MNAVASVDGRTQRRDRNRDAVLDAVITLFGKGVLNPSPDQVADASGVSLRSVYRYVSSRDELVQAALKRHVENVGALWSIHHIGVGTFAERLDRFLASRLGLYHAVANVNRAARALSLRNETLLEALQQGRQALRHQVERHFEPEFFALSDGRRSALLTAVDAVTQLDAIDNLVVYEHLDQHALEARLRDVVQLLLRHT